MKLLLLGATGRTGKLILASAIQRDFQVTCLVRNPDKVTPNKQVNIIQGNPINLDDLEKAAIDCDAVISALNISRTSDFPWAKLRTPKTYLSDVMTNVIQIADKHLMQRIVVCSAWGVLETKKDIPFWFRWFIDNSNIGVAYKDHERQEKILENSKTNWTVVRPVGLTNSKKKQTLKESFGNEPKPSMTVSRITVANYLLDCLDNKELTGKKVVISRA